MLRWHCVLVFAVLHAGTVFRDLEVNKVGITAI